VVESRGRGTWEGFWRGVRGGVTRVGGERSEWEGRWEALREAEGKGVVLVESGGDESVCSEKKERRKMRK